MASALLLARSAKCVARSLTVARPAAWQLAGRLPSQAVYSTDSHDDFQPQLKGEASKSVADQIREDVSTHPVFIYMKGQPERPMCGFSNMACRILDAHDVVYGSRDVLADSELREGIKHYTHWPTIPQVFIGGEFIGGSDILYQMHQDGELEKQLEAALKAKSSA